MPIQVLDKQVSELIAAGEVIERPASIVKELMENAFDAGATAVTVEIKRGGVSFIKVSDNGCGIAHDEAPTAFLRHATSKIVTEEDLRRISTLGFRGEALASVCAVSKVELLTKRVADTFGTRVCIEGGELQEHSEAGCPDGTTILVRDLFYNVPARLKFMKRDTTEAGAVTSTVEHAALSHPEVSVKLIKDNRTVLHTPGNGKLLSAVYSVLGREFAESLMPAEYEYNGIKVSGFVSDPMHGKNNRAFQKFFVNGRYVKTNVGTIATEEAYKNSIMVGRFPACVLCIEIDPEKVDVNVHPAKIEVRFTNEREVYDAVYFAVKTALTNTAGIDDLAQKAEKQKQEVLKAIQSNTFKTIEGEQSAFTPSAPQSKTVAPKTPVAPEKAERFSRIIPETDTADEPSSVGRLREPHQTTYSTEKQADPFYFIKPEHTASAQTPKEKQPTPPEKPIEPIKPAEEKPQTDIPQPAQPIRLIGELFNTYILAQEGDVFLMIDKHAAHERILFEDLKANAGHDRQILLSPLTVTLSRAAHTAFLEHLSEVEELGFAAEDFGDTSILVREVPSVLSGYDMKAILCEIADDLLALKKDLSPTVLEDLYHSVACKAAIKANDKNSDAELMALLERVCTDEKIRYCPHGRPVVIATKKSEIQRTFGRS